MLSTKNELNMFQVELYNCNRKCVEPKHTVLINMLIVKKIT
jgi:hypothetical protein